MKNLSTVLALLLIIIASTSGTPALGQTVTQKIYTNSFSEEFNQLTETERAQIQRQVMATYENSVRAKERAFTQESVVEMNERIIQTYEDAMLRYFTVVETSKPADITSKEFLDSISGAIFTLSFTSDLYIDDDDGVGEYIADLYEETIEDIYGMIFFLLAIPIWLFFAYNAIFEVEEIKVLKDDGLIFRKDKEKIVKIRKMKLDEEHILPPLIMFAVIMVIGVIIIF